MDACAVPLHDDVCVRAADVFASHINYYMLNGGAEPHGSLVMVAVV